MSLKKKKKKKLSAKMSHVGWVILFAVSVFLSHFSQVCKNNSLLKMCFRCCESQFGSDKCGGLEQSTPESGAFLFLNTSCRKEQETDKTKQEAMMDLKKN